MRQTALATCAAAACVALSACAPDAWQSYKASGFNDYLNVVQAKCQPLWVGANQMRTIDASAWAGQGGGFDQWLDTTSRLYYNRITPAQYRESVQALVMSTKDARTNRSIDCIIAQLPADRPTSPGGPAR
jgi:hypothetical protein